MCLIAIGYLYIDNRNTLTNQIDNLQEEVKALKKENVILYNKIRHNVMPETTKQKQNETQGGRFNAKHHIHLREKELDVILDSSVNYIQFWNLVHLH